MGDSLGNLSRSSATSLIRDTDDSASSWGDIFDGLLDTAQTVSQQLGKVAQQLQEATQEAMKSVDLAAAILAETLDEASAECSLCRMESGQFHLCTYPIEGLIGLVQYTDGVVECKYNGRYWLITKSVHRCPNCGRDLEKSAIYPGSFSLEEV